MKRQVASSLISTIVVIAGLSFSSTAFAQTSYPTSQKSIYLNGNKISSPAGIAAVDLSSNQKTTYMPIWYVMQALKSLGIQSQWDGHHWYMSLPTGMVPNTANVSLGKGTVTVYLNGTPVQTNGDLVYLDPASSVDTTYVPIWYIEQVLKRVNVTSSWDGITWGLKTSDNIVQNTPTYIVNLVETQISTLNTQSDPSSIYNQLYEEGYVTKNFVDEVNQQNSTAIWKQLVSQYGTTSAQISGLTVLKQDSPNSMVTDLQTTEKDTYADNTGKVSSVTQNNAWTVAKNSPSGLWQIDQVGLISQMADNNTSPSTTTGTN